MSKHVFVTGAAGHLGRQLVQMLVDEGFQVTGLDMAEPRPPLPPACRFVQADLSTPAAYREALQGVDVVAHCASIHPWKSYTDEQYLDCNVKGAWMLYAAAAEAGIKKIVLTSSIAAGCWAHAPVAHWPITEDRRYPVGDIYSYTKVCQEEAAHCFAAQAGIRTLALRPPAFMPKDDLETGFQLIGPFAVVADIASAHVGAVRVFAGLQQPEAPLKDFEAIFITNRLPYTAADAALLEGAGAGEYPLIRRYWPDAHDWLIARGYPGPGYGTPFDLSKAARLLGWEPQFNFEQWFIEAQDKGL